MAGGGRPCAKPLPLVGRGWGGVTPLIWRSTKLNKAAQEFEAATGTEALELFTSCNGDVDLVVSDVVMPEMTGVEFLYELRMHRPTLPVVLMTGGSKEPERTTKAVELGACSLLYKPFTHAELTAAVEAALETKLV